MRQIIFIVLLSLTITVNSDVLNTIFERRSISSVREILKCVSTYDYACILDYVEDGVDKAYKDLMREADAGARRLAQDKSRKKEEEEETPSSLLTTITNIFSELPELLRASLSAALSEDEGDEKTAEDAEDDEKTESSDDDDEEEEELDDEEGADVDENDDVKDDAESKTVAVNVTCKNNSSCAKIETKSNSAVKVKSAGVSRKKKKKGKIQKLKSFIKIAIAAIVLVVKLSILLKLLAAKLQIKFFLIALVNLAINIARFWWDLKKGHHPQKVIYYEHAQHQHHYDGGDDWHSSGPSGDSYWSRSYDKVDDKNAQDLAYSKQAPVGTTYSRVSEKPNFSWNPWAER
ncbi:hypothetical protein FQR65_LT07861 [Abscondita terminalis]|nr:hypothetical protein FQR65_LT07861 [Abscondita terminalis]